MHGLGNDFVVFDATRGAPELTPERLRWIADRHEGVGCDQILLVETTTAADADFRYRIFNADGSESGQCGNGARCFARFVREQRLTDADHIVLETVSGRMSVDALPDGRYTANVGVPVFEPAAIPLKSAERASAYDLEIASGESVSVQALSLGNPHAVLTVASVADAPVETLGAALERHHRFPERVNVGFMAVQDETHIDLRVYERGAGETRACGSGACAAVVAGRMAGKLAESVQVLLPGGMLAVEWAGEGEPVWLTGPATHVYDGTLHIQPAR